MQNAKIVVLVLGDVGRSPRMQYHALSLSKLQLESFDNKPFGSQICLIGYTGEPCIPEIQKSSNIRQSRFQPIQSVPNIFNSRSILLIIKAILLTQRTLVNLLKVGSFDVILVQNPPSIPALAIVWIVSRLRGAKMIIDWHNLGFSILEYNRKLPSRHFLVLVHKFFEQLFGQLADGHLCVSFAMQKHLEEWVKVPIDVFHDRPPHFFSKSTTLQKHKLFTSLSHQLIHVNEKFEKFCLNKFGQPAFVSPNDTLFTYHHHLSGEVRLRGKERPALLISSTSWTEDEDFSILLDALASIDRNDALPFFIVIVTGKGPLKSFYEQKISEMDLKNIAICTLWLEAVDYPVIIGSADLGISLHTSTSGLDLPMKVVDMLGCGVPVCAHDFYCLHELIQTGINGLVFSSSTELASQLNRLFIGFPFEQQPYETSTPLLRRITEGAEGFSRWDDEWSEYAAPLFCRTITKVITERTSKVFKYALIICVLFIFLSYIVLL